MVEQYDFIPEPAVKPSIIDNAEQPQAKPKKQADDRLPKKDVAFIHLLNPDSLIAQSEMIADITKDEEFILSKAEAKNLADSYTNFAQEFGFAGTSKTYAALNFLLTFVTITARRYKSFIELKNKFRKTKTKEQNDETEQPKPDTKNSKSG